MTRETQGLRESRDLDIDVDVLANLWAAAPFPRLPSDAPSELKKLTVDIEDPKRVYAIHHASRRHNVQALVERYILQIRYGCQSNVCVTPTCFSCRKRLAAGAPVRRYNATSARTLAVYLASLDNPEQGLCHNPSNDHPPPGLHKASNHAQRRSLTISTRDLPMRRLSERETQKSPPNGKGKSDRSSPAETKERATPEDFSAEDILDEPTRTDHRSFVQNVFGTVAFKMLEWLTPRNLEAMANAKKEDMIPGEATSDKVTPDSNGVAISSTVTAKRSEHEKEEHPIDVDSSTLETSKDFSRKKAMRRNTGDGMPISTFDGESSAVDDQQRISNTGNPFSSSTSRSTPDVNDARLPKALLNIKPAQNKALVSETPSSNKEIRRSSTINLAANPSHEVSDGELYIDGIPLSSQQSQETNQGVPKISIAQKEQLNVPVVPAEAKPEVDDVTKNQTKDVHRNSGDSNLPQSLSSLPMSVLDLICTILLFDGTNEIDGTKEDSTRDWASVIPRSLPFLGPWNLTPLQRHTIIAKPLVYPNSFKHQWRIFIEQSVFDVLSRPDSLLYSFSGSNHSLHDSQTLWWLMSRMTRVLPSLVFDSLWIVAGTLFHPPPLASNIPETGLQVGVSNIDAAKVLVVCLHALVAAIPMVSNASQLANMSRIRSYGLTMLGRGHLNVVEPVALCLEYDDAFSNDLALRLARRTFAAIPARRDHAMLREIGGGILVDGTTEPDILEFVLRHLDNGHPSTLEFSEFSRTLHEKRMPTLILDWARTVMLQDWKGVAEVPKDGPFGGALLMVSAIYKKRKSLLLGDIHFRTEYFAERLDPVEVPLEWYAFEPNRRTVHLLDYPFLFDSSTLVGYFRAINYSRMNQAYETAKASSALMKVAVSERFLMTDASRREALSNRLQIATARYMILTVRRKYVLQDTFNSMWRREERELLRPLKIHLGEVEGEVGIDMGGIQQEFFRLAIAEAMNPDYGTFTIDPVTQMAWFQPGSPEPLWKFELVGMIVSLAVYNGLTLPITFPKALYRKLLDEEVTELHHIADGWPDLAKGLTSLLEWDENEQGLVEDIFARTYEFGIEQFGRFISRDMTSSKRWPQFSDAEQECNPIDAPAVTNENRNNYVTDYIRWLTDVSVAPQFSAFKRGFFSLVDRQSTTLFDAETLQSVVEGIQDIDISELAAYTQYQDCDGSHPSVGEFWSIVGAYDHVQKKKLLEFVTASERVPVGGMQALEFKIVRSGADDKKFPSSSTCYNMLCLPMYSSKEVMRDQLAFALENSEGFGIY